PAALTPAGHRVRPRCQAGQAGQAGQAQDHRPAHDQGQGHAGPGRQRMSALARRRTIMALALASWAGAASSHAALAPAEPAAEQAEPTAASRLHQEELRAVQEELARAVAKLRLRDAPAPHRAEARWVRAQLLSLDGSYGGVITNVMQTQTAGVAELHVGTPQRDDSNFLGSDAGITRFDVPMEASLRFLRK